MLDEQAIERWIAHNEIVVTIQRYGLSVDRKDFAALRSVFADDAEASYDGAVVLRGADKIVAWIEEATRPCGLQHHMLSVCEVEFAGQKDAEALTYMISHQSGVVAPDIVTQIVARYEDSLRLIGGRWLIAGRKMETVWTDSRPLGDTVAPAHGGR
jgi:hypothetical protein